MSDEVRYPKRLIEVDLPIREISAHARREKSIRHGHISTLHLWWARRPLAACRSVALAAILPDPVDEDCPTSFLEAAASALSTLRDTIGGAPTDLRDPQRLRSALLNFIADFANWDLANSEPHLQAARGLVGSAHAALGGHSPAPLIVDPFAGGGAIPLECLRVGASVYASDLNPVAVLLNKLLLEQLPKHGRQLIREVEKWGSWMAEVAETELRDFYPTGGGGQPIAYLWTRTIDCEGPGCGMRVPLLKSGWIARRKGNLLAVKLRPIPKERRVEFELETPRSAKEVRPGTISGADVLCPACGFTTQKARVRAQLRERHGGVDDAVLYCVAVAGAGGRGRTFRLPTAAEQAATSQVREALSKCNRDVPDEPIPHERVWKNNPVRVHLYGIDQWSRLFAPRQRLLLATYARLAREASSLASARAEDSELADAVGTVLALAVSRLADISNAHCQWSNTSTQVVHLFGRQAISMTWDFAEAAPFTPGVAGNLLTTLGSMCRVLAREACLDGDATVARHSATRHALPDDGAQVLFTDPPYYDAVPYATLADFFYVWLRRAVPASLGTLFSDSLIDKSDECVVDVAKNKDRAYFERTMTAALAEARRVVAPDGIGIIVFAHKSTAGWEAQLKAMIDAGWVVTGSWPIDTERADRMRARDSAALASSVHLVCRPRENVDCSLATDSIGDWRSVLRELPHRIHEWMPRLASEGVVGADAIFACLGPALEIFSRYSHVEKASGERVELREYLEQVWAAVALEALSMIFDDADATGLEEDARLTAMWLWTLSAGTVGDSSSNEGSDSDPDDEGLPDTAPPSIPASGNGGYPLEFDTARKLAQALGVEISDLSGPGGIVALGGSTATLVRIGAREEKLVGFQLGLFASGEEFDVLHPTERYSRARQAGEATLRRVTTRQTSLFDERPEPRVQFNQPILPGLQPPPDTRTVTQRLLDGGSTTLDRLHQAMLLFGRGQTALLRPFLEEAGMLQSSRFWKLAQSLSALYPGGTEEKRWVDGVLARKKGLGF